MKCWSLLWAMMHSADRKRSPRGRVARWPGAQWPGGRGERLHPRTLQTRLLGLNCQGPSPHRHSFSLQFSDSFLLPPLSFVPKTGTQHGGPLHPRPGSLIPLKRWSHSDLISGERWSLRKKIFKQ